MATSRAKTLIAAGLFGLLFIGASPAMSILDIKLPLTGAWKERFQDVNKLNAYAKTQPVELSNTKIENATLDGAVLQGGKFEHTDWKNVSVKNANLTKTVLRKGVLENVNFSDSTLTDIVFEDIHFRGVRFYHATLANVRFVRCSFNGVNVDQTKNSRIEVIDSKAISSSFSEGQLVAVFRNTKFYEGVEITDLLPPSSLTFEKSELTEVNLDRSKLKTLVIEDTKYDAVLDNGHVESVIVKNSSVDTSFSASTIGKLLLTNTVVTTFSFNKAKAGSMSFQNCGQLRDFVMYGTSIDTLDIAHCKVSDFYPAVATIGVLRMKDSTVVKSGFERVKIKTLILENVTFDGELDFSGAQVGELKTHDVIKLPGLKLTTSGSNVRF